VPVCGDGEAQAAVFSRSSSRGALPPDRVPARPWVAARRASDASLRAFHKVRRLQGRRISAAGTASSSRSPPATPRVPAWQPAQARGDVRFQHATHTWQQGARRTVVLRQNAEKKSRGNKQQSASQRCRYAVEVAGGSIQKFFRAAPSGYHRASPPGARRATAT